MRAVRVNGYYRSLRGSRSWGMSAMGDAGSGIHFDQMVLQLFAANCAAFPFALEGHA